MLHGGDGLEQQVASLVRHVFFFSSRRRHTRLTCDWSSDVCSSDLSESAQFLVAGEVAPGEQLGDGNVEPDCDDVLRRNERSEERRVGKEWRYGWATDELKKNKETMKRESINSTP